MRSSAFSRAPVVIAALLPVALLASGCASAGSGHAPAPSASAPATGPAAHRTTTTKTPGGSAASFEVPGTRIGCPGPATTVSSASELRSALYAARPGETIRLAPGSYVGNFFASRSGTAAAPITLCGSRAAVLVGPTTRHGYDLYLDGASWWRVLGFALRGGQKGIVADRASHDLLYGLSVSQTGDEAIHLRSFSSDDTISHCVVRHAGLLVQFYGEGIYVGSAHSNWCRYTACKADASDDDQIIDNDVAETTAENVDIKEGTTGGLIAGNHFDGIGMLASAATAWVNVKGNDWTIKDNFGIDSVGDGLAVHQVYPGWGIGNKFVGNHEHVNGPGYGIYVQSHDLHTSVACDNVATHAAAGQYNLPCSPTG